MIDKKAEYRPDTENQDPQLLIKNNPLSLNLL